MDDSTRAINMEKRRQRILVVARTTIAREGVDGLTVRKLASEAGITVPTIYNLIGTKDDLFRRLLDELVSRAEETLSEVEEVDPIEATARVVRTLATLFAEDEDFCRAALRAGQGLERSGRGNGALRIWQRSAQVANRICIDAANAGLLRGDCDPVRIAERAFDSYRIAAIDWLDKVIDVSEFERNALIGFYLCLAADAVPRFRRALMSRIAEVDSDAVRPKARARYSRS
ncbi:MAG: TetR family transcriptional regulator [Deltaproteobacteria bacterium]|nr:TetR family transcriptional regulator [Deltaproteobacteria bacterium]